MRPASQMKFLYIFSVLFGFGVSQRGRKRNAYEIVQRYDIHQISLLKLTRFFRATDRFFSDKQAAPWRNLVKAYKREMQRATSSSKVEVTLDYVSKYEDAIKAFNPNVTVPYWNYTVYHQYPKLDPVFLNYMFGADVNFDKCLTNGNFKDYKGLSGSCLKRELYAPGTSLPEPSDLDAMLKQASIAGALASLDKMTLRVEQFLGGMFMRNQSIYDPLHYCIQGFNLKLLKQWSLNNKFDLTTHNPKYASVTDDIYALA